MFGTLDSQKYLDVLRKAPIMEIQLARGNIMRNFPTKDFKMSDTSDFTITKIEQTNIFLMFNMYGRVVPVPIPRNQYKKFLDLSMLAQTNSVKIYANPAHASTWNIIAYQDTPPLMINLVGLNPVDMLEESLTKLGFTL